MNDRLPSLSIEARERHPYRSLYAALLFQGFQDALADAMPDDSGGGRDKAPPRTRTAAPHRHSTVASQA
jgi:hypothetical protein